MKAILFAIINLALTFAAWGQPGCDTISLSNWTTDGKTTIHKITETEAQRLPEWDPESGKPAPLPMDVAIKTGKEWLKKKYPKIDDFKIQSVTLEKIRNSSIPNRWFYNIRFDPFLGDLHVFGPEFMAVVLMNGSVVEPVIREAGKAISDE
jgi:hypothetical protein